MITLLITSRISELITLLITSRISELITSWITFSELSYATCTRINAVGTKVQFAFAVPVSALVKAPIDFPLSVQIVRPESGKTFRHKRKSFVIPNTSLYRGS